MNLALNERSGEVAFVVAEREMKLLVGCALWVEGVMGEARIEDIDEARRILADRFSVEEIAALTAEALELAETAGRIGPSRS